MRLACLLAIVSGCGFAPSLAHDAAPGSGGDDAHVFEDAPPGGGSGITAHRKTITIHGGMVTGMPANFPVWIDLVDTDIAASARNDGTDIFFTAADGAALDFERESWSPSMHRLQAWVRVPALAHNTDTIIYVEYGDLAKALPPNPTGVFSASFAAVWHLDDALSSATVVDTTGTHPGTASGLGPNDSVDGHLVGGVAFNGQGTDQITFDNPLTGNVPHTISAWVNQATTNHTSSIIVMGTNGTDQSRFLYGRYGTNATIGVGQYNDDWQVNNDIEGDGWVLVHWVLEGANKKHHVYVNGAEIAGSPHTAGGSPNTTASTGIIGNAPAPTYGPANGMAGTIDELRIATVIRDPAWIATEYANQSTPNAFYAVGPEQIAP